MPVQDIAGSGPDRLPADAPPSPPSLAAAERPRAVPRQLPPPPPEEEPRWTGLERLMIGLLAFMAVVGVLLTVAGIPLAAVGGKALLVVPAVVFFCLLKGER